MKQYLLVMLPIMLLIACSKSNEGAFVGPDVLPLKVGNTWTYAFTFQDPLSSGIIDSDQITFTISSDTVINGGTWYKDFFDDRSNFYRSTSGNIEQYNVFDNKVHLFFSLTHKASQLVYQDVTANENIQLYAFDSIENVNGYSGVYQNVDSVFNTTSQMVVNYNNIYDKPGIGIVQIDEYNTKNLSSGGGAPFSLNSTFKLISYSLK